MGDIIIKLTAVCNSEMCAPTVPQTINIRNFKTISINQRTPNQVMAIPQLPDKCTIVIKAEGNITTINVGWTIKDETPCGSIVTECACVKTVPQQIKYFMNTFVNKNIGRKYSLDLDGDWDVLNVKPNFLIMEKTERTPITWTANWEFVIGDIQSTVIETTS